MAKATGKQPAKRTPRKTKRAAPKPRPKPAETMQPEAPIGEGIAGNHAPRHGSVNQAELQAAMEESYRQLQSIYTAFTQQYTDAGTQYQKLSEQGYVPEMADLYKEFTETRGAEIAQEGLQLAIRYAASAQALSKRYTDELFQFLNSRGITGYASDTGFEPQSASISLTGAAGNTLSASFDVENSTATSVSPRVTTTPVLDEDGAAVEGAMIDVVPELINLAPGQKQLVKIMIPLDADLYRAGHSYSSALVIVGLGQARNQLISLEIDVT